jgi:hypothetical protein
MIFEGKHGDGMIGYGINESMVAIDSSRPFPGKVEFEGFRMSYSGKRTFFDGFQQRLYFPYDGFVGAIPVVQILFGFVLK